MVDSNLAVLLAERNLKITRVSRDTGISRTTLTALCNDYTGGIKFDTLNVLCKYLKVTPQDFFNYLPYDYEITVYEDETEDNMKALEGLSDKLERIYDISITITKHEHKWLLPLNVLVEASDTVPFHKILIGIMLAEDIEDENANLADVNAYREFKQMIQDFTPRQVERFKSDVEEILKQHITEFLADKYKVPADKLYAENVAYSCIINFMD